MHDLPNLFLSFTHQFYIYIFPYIYASKGIFCSLLMIIDMVWLGLNNIFCEWTLTLIGAYIMNVWQKSRGEQKPKHGP